LIRSVLLSTLRVFLVMQFIFATSAHAEDGVAGSAFTVHKEEPQFKTGSVFFSSTKKNEVLFKANVWGAVQFPGVHYMPFGSRFLDAISFAGGPIDAANPDHILLSTKELGKEPVIRDLSVSKALTSQDFNPVIQPDDIILVKEDHTKSNVTFYLSIGTFLMTAVALGLLVSQNNK
jgi:hypothetical protein